jgi:hypothetical protein
MAKMGDPQLFEAINKADADAIRSLLKTMCTSSEVVRQHVQEHLLVVSSASRKRKGSGRDSMMSRTSTKKQKNEELTARYEACTTCGEVFDVSMNFKDSCQTHDGKWLESFS